MGLKCLASIQRVHPGQVTTIFNSLCKLSIFFSRWMVSKMQSKTSQNCWKMLYFLLLQINELCASFSLCQKRSCIYLHTHTYTQRRRGTYQWVRTWKLKAKGGEVLVFSKASELKRIENWNWKIECFGRSAAHLFFTRLHFPVLQFLIIIICLLFIFYSRKKCHKASKRQDSYDFGDYARSSS